MTKNELEKYLKSDTEITFTDEEFEKLLKKLFKKANKYLVRTAPILSKDIKTLKFYNEIINVYNDSKAKFSLHVERIGFIDGEICAKLTIGLGRNWEDDMSFYDDLKFNMIIFSNMEFQEFQLFHNTKYDKINLTLKNEPKNLKEFLLNRYLIFNEAKNLIIDYKMNEIDTLKKRLYKEIEQI